MSSGVFLSDAVNELILRWTTMQKRLEPELFKKEVKIETLLIYIYYKKTVASL